MALLIDGDDLRSSRFAEAVPSIGSRVRGALFGAIRGTQGPTETHRQQLEIARTEFADIREELKSLLEDELEEFEKKLDDAGIAWTTGRALPGN